MNLLIITQKVDKNDTNLGFFHDWLLEFAKNFEKVIVICLEKKNYSFPDNVKVISLGKDKDLSKLSLLFNFYKAIWQERKNYDAVFVHMTPIYITLGGIFWKLYNKKISLWFTHKSVTIWLYLAEKFWNVSFINKLKFIKYWSRQFRGLKSMTSFYYEPHNWAGTRDYLKSKMGLLDRLLSKFSLKKPCMYIKGMNINYNGGVYVCTNDPTKKAVIGNINQNSIQEIYNGEKREKFLQENEKGTFLAGNYNICTANTVLPLSFI